jgi:GDP-D-mannose dehydratase
MARPWEDVLKDFASKKVPPEAQEEIRQEYFLKNIAPRMQGEDLNKAYRWWAETAPTTAEAEVVSKRQQYLRDRKRVESDEGLDWRDFVVQDQRYMRPAEVDLLVSDPTKARVALGWEPRTSFEDLVHMMVDADLTLLASEGGGD